MDKKSFVVYFSIEEIIEELNDEQVGQLFRAMVAFAITGGEPDFDGVLRMAWIPIRQTLERDAGKYMELVEKRKKAGQKGGIASGEARRSKTVENSTKTKQSEAKPKNEADNVNVNVNVNDNDNDNDNVNVNVNVNDNEFASDGRTDGLLTLGVKENVRLYRSELAQIRATYQQTQKLIDKVSLWLDKAKHPPEDHAALVHKFAVNDDWPRKPKPEPPPEPPDPERGEFCGPPPETRQKLTALGLALVGE